MHRSSPPTLGNVIKMAAEKKAEGKDLEKNEHETEAKGLVEDLYQFNRCYFQSHDVEEASKKDSDVKNKMDETVKLLSHKEGKIPRPLYQYLRGKALNVLPSYSKEAEVLLSQAVKQNPLLVDAWNALGESYWKTGNVSQAHHCFTGALNHELNKESLRNLSMVLRQLGTDDKEKKKNITESLEKAKQAVSIDVKDGISWMILGNAYLAVFFSVEANPKMLQQASSAYTQAEKDPIALKNPDLHFNMATLLVYDEKYNDGLYHLEQSRILEPGWPTPHQKLTSLKRFLQNFSRLVGTKGKLKPKRLGQLQEAVAAAAAASKDVQVLSIRDIREGKGSEEESGPVLLGAVASCFTTDERVPVACVLIDAAGDSIGFTVYNLIHNYQFSVGDIITIPRPTLSHISIPEIEVDYDSMRCVQPQALMVNGSKISSDKLSTSVVHVTAFS